MGWVKPGFDFRRPDTIMKFVEIKCSFCKEKLSRTIGRINETKKFKWRQFCSWKCLANSKKTRTSLFCSNPGCNKKFYRVRNQIKKVKRCFCSNSCAAIFNNAERYSKLPLNLCANPSCKIPIPRDKKYCSSAHRINPRKIPEKIYQERIIARIKSFYKKHGRIPVKREMDGIYKAARALFGSWNHAIEAAGLTPNPVRFAKRHVANDGHICDSLAEKVIDDWLSNHTIKHRRSIAYPNSSYTADFSVKGTLIEFFGLSGELEEYDRNMQIKERLVKKHNLKLLRIYPKDIFPSNKLDHILEGMKN